jgi:hypothetical protein
MPLSLGGVETERQQTVVWNPNEILEVNDAQKRIHELQEVGFSIIKEENGEAILKAPPKDPNKGIFRILTDNGDDRIVWDRRSGSEVKEAYSKFNDLLAQGYSAYAVTASGGRGHKLDLFDPSLEEIIMIPKTRPG